MDIKTMLVTGANGMVGSYVRKVFRGVELIPTDITGDCQHLDVRNPNEVMETICSVSPQVVLHLAAATDVDRCEQDPDWAYHSNTIGTQNVALACQASGCVMVYISTAGVFRGDKPEPYTEFDRPRPMNLYGDSKLQGEKIVSTLLDKFYIARAGWMVGGGEKDTKFVGKITQKIVEGATHLRVVDDKFGSPTYAKDLLGGVMQLLESDQYGLYHMVNKGAVSRLEVALAIKEILNRPEVEIEPVNSACFPLPAPRARSEMMRNYKLDLMEHNSMRFWKEALSEYLQEELLPAIQGDFSDYSEERLLATASSK
jgi:dTDP-4-dehydrorhamnose reductase